MPWTILHVKFIPRPLFLFFNPAVRWSSQEMHCISEVRLGNITELSKKAGLMVYSIYSSEPPISDCKFVLKSASSVCAVLQRRYRTELSTVKWNWLKRNMKKRKRGRKLLLAILNKWKLMQRNLFEAEESNLMWATFWFMVEQRHQESERRNID